MSASTVVQQVPKLVPRVILAIACVFATVLTAPTAASASSSRPAYHGGPVQTQPQIYIDFWGTWTPDPLGERSYLTDFVRSIDRSAWLKTLGQYRVGWQKTTYKGSWSDPDLSHRPGRNPSQSATEAEVTRAAKHFGIRSNPNIQIIIALPHGGTCNPYHSQVGGVAFVAYPYNGDPFPRSPHTAQQYCAGGAQTVSHEIAEAMTDPFPSSGWSPEVADAPCSGNAGHVRMPNGKVFYVQQLFSNSANRCVLKS